LERLGKKYTRFSQHSSLIKASREYRRVKNIMEEYMLLFPYYDQKNNLINYQRR